MKGSGCFEVECWAVKLNLKLRDCTGANRLKTDPWKSWQTPNSPRRPQYQGYQGEDENLSLFFLAFLSDVKWITSELNSRAIKKAACNTGRTSALMIRSYGQNGNKDRLGLMETYRRPIIGICTALCTVGGLQRERVYWNAYVYKISTKPYRRRIVDTENTSRIWAFLW